jgi:hypothetical protein
MSTWFPSKSGPVIDVVYCMTSQKQKRDIREERERAREEKDREREKREKERERERERESAAVSQPGRLKQPYDSYKDTE